MQSGVKLDRDEMITFNTPLEMRYTVGRTPYQPHRLTFNTPLEMPPPFLFRLPPLPIICFQYSIGDAPYTPRPQPRQARSFNTPLEMQLFTRARLVCSSRISFQYSIGDADVVVLEDHVETSPRLSILHWRCPLLRPPGRNGHHSLLFQYSIGDARNRPNHVWIQLRVDPFNTPLEMQGGGVSCGEVRK